MANFDTRFAEKVLRQRVRIRVAEDDATDAGVEDHLGAGHTWFDVSVDDGVPQTDTIQGCLDNRILFGVEASAELELVAGSDSLLLAKAGPFFAVTQAARGAVVASGENALVVDDNGADLAPDAR